MQCVAHDIDETVCPVGRVLLVVVNILHFHKFVLVKGYLDNAKHHVTHFRHCYYEGHTHLQCHQHHHGHTMLSVARAKVDSIHFAP